MFERYWILYPLNWSIPIPFAYMIDLPMQSTSTFYAASRLAGATPPPAYVLSRSIGLHVITEHPTENTCVYIWSWNMKWLGGAMSTVNKNFIVLWAGYWNAAWRDIRFCRWHDCIRVSTFYSRGLSSQYVLSLLSHSIESLILLWCCWQERGKCNLWSFLHDDSVKMLAFSDSPASGAEEWSRSRPLSWSSSPFSVCHYLFQLVLFFFPSPLSYLTLPSHPHRKIRRLLCFHPAPDLRCHILHSIRHCRWVASHPIATRFICKFGTVNPFFWGVAVAVGISFMQFANSNSMRNHYVLGVSLFLGISISEYFVLNTSGDGHGPVKTGGGWVSLTKPITVSAEDWS